MLACCVTLISKVTMWPTKPLVVRASKKTKHDVFSSRFCRLHLVSELLDRFLQGQYLVEEGALEHRLEQAELLLRGHLPPFLQFGLEAFHRLQGTLRICKPSHISVTWWSGCREEKKRWVREVEVARTGALSGRGKRGRTKGHLDLKIQ